MFSASCLFLVAEIPSAEAKVLQVRQDGTGDHTTIQAGIDALAPGDQCLVGPGVYPERLTFPAGKSGTALAWTIVQAEKPGTVKIQGADMANCNYLRLQGFEIAPPAAGINAGIEIHSSFVEIVSNALHDFPQIALAGTGSHVTVRGNRISRCGSGMDIAGDQWLVDGNSIERLQPTTGGEAFDLRFVGESHLIRSNHLSGTVASEVGAAQITGFQTTDRFGQSARHIVIENNLLEGFYHRGISLNAGVYSNSFDVIVRNNLFIAPAVGGVSVAGNLREVKIYNNTIINAGNFGVRFTDHSSGEIRNNVLFSKNSTASESELPQLMYSADASSSVSGGQNLLYVQDRTLSATQFPNDLVNQDPKFVSLVTGNYRLRPGSPGINAGVALTGFNYDFNGLERPQGSAWDMGAYEFSNNAIQNRPAPPGNLRFKH